MEAFHEVKQPKTLKTKCVVNNTDTVKQVAVCTPSTMSVGEFGDEAIELAFRKAFNKNEFISIVSVEIDNVSYFDEANMWEACEGAEDKIVVVVLFKRIGNIMNVSGVTVQSGSKIVQNDCSTTTVNQGKSGNVMNVSGVTVQSGSKIVQNDFSTTTVNRREKKRGKKNNVMNVSGNIMNDGCKIVQNDFSTTTTTTTRGKESGKVMNVGWGTMTMNGVRIVQNDFSNYFF